MPMKAMWKCKRCGRKFANRNQSHFCSKHTLDEHLRGRSSEVIALYRRLVRLVRKCGRVAILPEKTRIAFQVRMSFAQVSFRRDKLRGHVTLARRLEHPRFLRIDTISPQNHVHHFELRSTAELDEEFSGFLREAYRVGQQLHLKS
jgi:hypothetical protein